MDLCTTQTSCNYPTQRIPSVIVLQWEYSSGTSRLRSKPHGGDWSSLGRRWSSTTVGARLNQDLTSVVQRQWRKLLQMGWKSNFPHWGEPRCWAEPQKGAFSLLLDMQAGNKNGTCPDSGGQLVLNHHTRIFLGYIQRKPLSVWKKPRGSDSISGDVVSMAVSMQSLFFCHIQLLHQCPCLPATAVLHSLMHEKQVAPWDSLPYD